MSNLKPIETTYNGYRFRSRLEARWAVFFDALGFSWEYEKEGFDLNGTPYLPDFYLPQWGAWVEIKPKVFEMESAGHDKCLLLSKATKPDKVMLVSGNPYQGEHSVICCNSGYTEWVGEFTEGVADDKRTVQLCLSAMDGKTKYTVATMDLFAIDYAFMQARQARFEHGDNKSVTPYADTTNSVVDRFILEAIRSKQ